MKYYYNYSFLNKWMEANRDITNKQVMRAMGTTSNTCLDSWVRMKSPLPTIALLRFCNAFHVPLSAFIVDADFKRNENCENMEHVCPDVNDQFEPDGGYLENDAKRQLGTRALRDPLDVDRIKSVVPGLTSDGIAGNGGALGTSAGKQGAAAAVGSAVGSAVEMASEEDSMPMAEKPHAKAIEHDISMDMLNRMLDIIAEQQKQIGDQQKLIGELTRRLNSQQTRDNSMQTGYDTQQAGYGMVAEEMHHHE